MDEVDNKGPLELHYINASNSFTIFVSIDFNCPFFIFVG